MLTTEIPNTSLVATPLCIFFAPPLNWMISPWLDSRFVQFLRSPASKLQLNGRKMTVRLRQFRRRAFELAKMNIIEDSSRRVRAEGAHATTKNLYFLHVWGQSNFYVGITPLISNICKVELTTSPKRPITFSSDQNWWRYNVSKFPTFKLGGGAKNMHKGVATYFPHDFIHVLLNYSALRAPNFNWTVAKSP